MDRALATRETVFKACDELLLSGQYPSARSVVAITKGSLSTVGPLRDEWWRQLAVSYRDSKFLKGVPPNISDFLTGVWAAACEHASRRFDADAAQLKIELADARAAHDQAAERASGFEAQLDREKDQSSLFAERLARLQSAHDQLSRLHAETVDSHRAELLSIGQLHADKIAAAQASAADAARSHAEATARHEDERRRLMLQVDSCRQESIRVSEASLAAAAQHEAAAHAASQRLDQMATQNRDLSASLATARAEASALAAQLAAAQAHAAQVVAERDALVSRVQAAEALLESQAKVISDQVQASRDINLTLAGFQTLLAPTGRQKQTSTRSARQK
jgi:chromosome segregation ATPase